MFQLDPDDPLYHEYHITEDQCLFALPHCIKENCSSSDGYSSSDEYRTDQGVKILTKSEIDLQNHPTLTSTMPYRGQELSDLFHLSDRFRYQVSKKSHRPFVRLGFHGVGFHRVSRRLSVEQANTLYRSRPNPEAVLERPWTVQEKLAESAQHWDLLQQAVRVLINDEEWVSPCWPRAVVAVKF